MGGKTPGPAGQADQAQSIDDGTLARTSSPKPGPSGPPPTAGSTGQGSAAPQLLSVPVDIFLIELQIVAEEIETYEVSVGRQKQTQKRKVRKVVETVKSGQTEDTIDASIARANQIWKPAGIAFRLNQLTPKEIEFDSKTVSEEGFLTLVATLKLPRSGLSMMFVRNFESSHLGGQAVEALGAGIVTYLGNPMQGNTLAHELGHLLGLPDLKHVANSVKNRYNLMYEAVAAGYDLTADQAKTALENAKRKLH